ncbi:MAG TPA: DUF192 domain-containing protein [Rhizomicrobium sp.]
MRSLLRACAAALLLVCGAEPALCLPVATISIDTPKGPAQFQMEIAADQKSQEQGLMYRTKMAPNAGMLFDLHVPQPVAFWMKNTYLPLDIVFVRADGTISTVEPNAIPMSTDSIPSAEPVRAVIELNGGRAHDLGIVPGAQVHGSIFGK